MAGIVETPVQIIQEVLPNPIYDVSITDDGSYDSVEKTIQVNRKVDVIVVSSSCCGSNASISSYSYAGSEVTCEITYKDNTTENLEVISSRQISSHGSDSNIKIFSNFKNEILTIKFRVYQNKQTSGKSGSFACGTIVII